ncbi:MAG: competence/damage-inducible protein A [Thermoplasmatota archaeon]
MLEPSPDASRTGALVVGNEILLGRTKDTNTVFLAEQLFNRGLRLTRWVIVPDIEEDIARELNRFITDNFGIVVVAGGMGPTHDDITVPAVAKALYLPLEFNRECYNRMLKKWQSWNPGKTLPESGRRGLEKMAQVPRDFDLINNEEGMVEGLVGSGNKGKTLIFILPGVPREYKGIVGTYKFQDYLPKGDSRGIVFKEVLFRGKESQMAPFLEELQRKCPDIDIGSYPQGPWKVILRVTGPSESVEKAVMEIALEAEKLEEENREEFQRP